MHTIANGAFVDHVREISRRVDFSLFDKLFRFIVRPDREGATVQARFTAECLETGRQEFQLTRRWLISPHATDSEIVQTLFKLCLAAVEHETREAFRYRGAPVFGPHFDVEVLVGMCERGATDARDDHRAAGEA